MPQVKGRSRRRAAEDGAAPSSRSSKATAQAVISHAGLVPLDYDWLVVAQNKNKEDKGIADRKRKAELEGGGKQEPKPKMSRTKQQPKPKVVRAKQQPKPKLSRAKQQAKPMMGRAKQQAKPKMGRAQAGKDICRGKQPRKGTAAGRKTRSTPPLVRLEDYSSPGIFDRAYIPNPAIPEDGVDPADTFSVVSYNILAECHRTKTDYSYTALEFLGLEYRHAQLMRELQYLDADIVCLQEVDPIYFENILLPAMQKLGYEGLVKKRTKYHMDEGEATFYKMDIFELETSEGVSLTEVIHKEIDAFILDPVVNTAAKEYTDRPDVVLITRLCCKATKKSVTVGNVHIVHSDVDISDVQCLQAVCAIKELLRVAGGEEAAYVLCGDFNGNPHSPVKRLVDEQELSVGHLQRLDMLKIGRGHGPGEEPAVTCFTDRTWILDYVFFSSQTLQAMGVLQVVDKDVIQQTGGLPSKSFPSDHLPLKANLALTM
ncbi:hypothetical protein BaRGS_00016682 [Batillaria attramentaria]|uniref:Endonuclease/exonuclease/phosphatase domain-containing protein n=1 Tax=Batillaria attramentaria TaxID=370345 RepID=A0ABD0KYK0_9CAEN